MPMHQAEQYALPLGIPPPPKPELSPQEPPPGEDEEPKGLLLAPGDTSPRFLPLGPVSPRGPREEGVETLDPEVEDAMRAYALGDPEEEAQLRARAKNDPRLRHAFLHPGGGLASGPPPCEWAPKEE
jgi:hypothetical protein